MADPITLRVTATVSVGNDPHEVVASTDGAIAFVSNYGFGAYNTLAVVDLVARQSDARSRSRPFARPARSCLRGRQGLA